MKILKKIYKKVMKTEGSPYYLDYSLLTIIGKPCRKFVAQVLTPNCPFNNIRVFLYRCCGFKIGKHVFIGMKCYLDDTCYDMLRVENNVTISYGVYFACHSKGQGHFPIVIQEGAYIGMRASIISKTPSNSKNGICIHKNAIVGASALVNRDVPEGATVVGIPCRVIHLPDVEIK